MNVRLTVLFALAVSVASASAHAQQSNSISYDDLEPASSDNGLTTLSDIKLFRMGDDVLAELPDDIFGRDLFWYAEVGRAPTGATFLGGLPVGKAFNEGKLVRLVHADGRVIVVDYSSATSLRPAPVDDGGGPGSMAVAVGEASIPSLMTEFPVVLTSPTGHPVVNISAVFGKDVPGLSVTTNLAAAGFEPAGVDPTRSGVATSTSFPDNLYVTNLLTFVSASGEAATIEVRHSLVILPEPMRPRLFDPRVGFFNLSYTRVADSGTSQQSLVIRHRLEKADPAAPVSDPIDPIVYYVSPEVPAIWKPAIRQGILSWNPAFEAAGFSNALEVREAPSPDEDPTWNVGNANISVVRWLVDPGENAVGAKMFDPRTGEIISNHILVWEEVIDLAADWYFSMVAPLDPRAAKLPYSIELKGELLTYAIAHEVGHALGLRHNHKAGTAYSVADLRDREFACRNGSVASLMSYGRFNYVAQPEDGIPPECLFPRIGPYDFFAIEWGYRQYPDAATPLAELPHLDALARRVETKPDLRWLTDEHASDPADPEVLRQNVGAERVLATRLGLDNLERVMDLLPNAVVTERPGPADREEAVFGYEAVLHQFRAITMSVPRMIGGVVQTPTYVLGEDQYAFVSAEDQSNAVEFLNERVFDNVDAYVAQDFLSDLFGAGALESVSRIQQAVLGELLTRDRFARLSEGEERHGSDAYTAAAFLSDLQGGLWSELRQDSVSITPLRRSIQLYYLRKLADIFPPRPIPQPPANPILAMLNPAPPMPTFEPDVQASIVGAAADLVATLTEAQPRASDRATADHIGYAISLAQRLR